MGLGLLVGDETGGESEKSPIAITTSRTMPFALYYFFKDIPLVRQSLAEKADIGICRQ
jgi:hypothetical protein